MAELTKQHNRAIDGQAKEETKMFEILTCDGSRFRFEGDEYRWQYGLYPGTVDVDDRTIVEVFQGADDDSEALVLSVSQVIAVGSVSAYTYMTSPFRERQRSQCPRCGFVG